MGERCYFGIERENGTVDAIYIHWCTNPKEATNDLRRGGYTTYEKVEELIGRGGASSILLDSKYDRVYDDMPSLAFESADIYVDEFRDNLWSEFLYLFRWKTKTWEYMVANACNGAYSERKFQGWEALDLNSTTKTVKISIAELVEQGFEIEVPTNATKEEIFKSLERCTTIASLSSTTVGRQSATLRFLRTSISKTTATTRWKSFKTKEIAEPKSDCCVKMEVLRWIPNVEAEKEEEAKIFAGSEAEGFIETVQWEHSPDDVVEIESYEQVGDVEVYKQEEEEE